MSITDEKLVVATLKAAAEACVATCGKWDKHKPSLKVTHPDQELICPCAEAILNIDPKTIKVTQ